MSFLFGGGNAASIPMQRVDPTRECRRTLHRGVRTLQREQKELLTAEQKDIAMVKNYAARGDMSAVKSSAMQLVRTRNRIKRNNAMQNRMTAMDRRFSDISSSQTMTEAMRTATSAMSRMTGATDLAAMARILKEFDKQNGSLDERMDMIDEAIDSMCEFEGQDEEISDAVGQVLTEIGLDVSLLTDKPPTALGRPNKDDDADIERRLLQLRFPTP